MKTTTRPLNANQRRFVAEYVSDAKRNATAAYMRAYGHDNYAAAAAQASKLLADPRIQAEVEKWESQLRDKLELTAEDIARELFLVASADPRELSEHYVGACRYCHGDGFKYQRTPAEYDRDVTEYVKQRRKDKNPDDLALEFDPLGGIGFNPKRAPNPDCPECFGDGEAYTVFKDTRDLSPAAARLYQGVKKTKDGLEIKVRNADKALELAGRHLGLFKDGLQVSGPNGGPIPVSSVSAVTNDPIEAARLYQKLLGGG